VSMYGMVFGENRAAGFLLGLLDLTKADVGRFRDCWVTKDGRIAVYTRNGGGNRDCWDSENLEKAYSAECGCPGCTIGFKLPKHPLYESDRDDEYDPTYATVYFRIPEGAKKLLEGLGEAHDPDAEWLKAIEDLKAGKRPDVVEAMRPVIERICGLGDKPHSVEAPAVTD